MTSWCSPPRTRATWSAVTVAAFGGGRVRQGTALLGLALRRRCADGAVREVEPLPDLAVREALCRELRDLQLLCGQLVARLGDATSAPLAGRAQLAPRLLPPRHAAQGVEPIARGAQDGA